MMFRSSRAKSLGATHKNTGYRSGAEVQTASHLASSGVPHYYERHRLPYTQERTYTPDFALPNQAIFIEVKGMFAATDRAKMTAIKEQYPNVDIRLLFQNPNVRLTKNSKTTYGGWCDKRGILWSRMPMPDEWFRHEPTKVQRESYDNIFFKP